MARFVGVSFDSSASAERFITSPGAKRNGAGKPLTAGRLKMRELYLVGSGFMPILPIEKISSVLTTSHCISFNFVKQNCWKIQTIHRVEA